MRKLLMTIAVVLVTLTASAQDGLQFIKSSSFQEALNIAKQQDKILMVDVYTTWCGPCTYLAENIFPSAELNDLNEVMIGYKIDAEKGEGVSFASKWNVRAYPTMLFFYDGEHIGTMKGGAATPEDFIKRILVEIMEVDPSEV